MHLGYKQDCGYLLPPFELFSIPPDFWYCLIETGQPKGLKRNDLSNQSDILAIERSGDQIPDAATSFQSKAAKWNCRQSSENYTQISQWEINYFFSSLVVMCVFAIKLSTNRGNYTIVCANNTLTAGCSMSWFRLTSHLSGSKCLGCRALLFCLSCSALLTVVLCTWCYGVTTSGLQWQAPLLWM